jgi:hypothetical protein
VLKPLSFIDFTARTGISQSDLFRGWSPANQIVSLREIEVDDLRVMPMDYLRQVLDSVTLSGSETHPYRGCAVETGRLDPTRLKLAQTFVERPKYQAMLESFSSLFKKFCVTKGVAKCTALIASGRGPDGRHAIAHYLPPIVEDHGANYLLDGVHRNFLVMSVGTTLEAIFIEGVKSPYPCTPQSWDKVVVVAAKPPKDQRYFNLDPKLFRDLEGVGIDG